MSEPAGAAIALDGKDTKLVTPAQLPIAGPGTHRLRLSKRGFQTVDARLAASDVRKGSLSYTLAPAETPAPPAAAAIAVTASGGYPFAIFDGSRLLSASSTSHQLNVGAGKKLRLVAPEYPLNQTVTVERTDDKQVDFQVPALANVTIRSNQETCKVKIGDRDLGYPPINNLKMAGGSYQVDVVCPNGQSNHSSSTSLPAGRTHGSSFNEAIEPYPEGRRRGGRRCHSTAVLHAQGNTEEFARRQYESGVAFMQNGRYAEALKDFQAVLESFAHSSVADNALLQIALYQLEVPHDTAAAQGTVERLLKDYPETDSAPMAYVLSGRIALAKGRAPADVDSALASFERVPRLFPNDEAVPAAGFYAGDTLRIVRRTEEALERFRRVSMEFPRSVWAARARIGAGLCLVAGDRAPRALEELQRVRFQLPESAEGAEALNLNTILYRLYVRAPAQPAYAFSTRFAGTDGAKLKDIVGVQFDPSGNLLVGHKLGVSVFDPKGKLLRTASAEEPSAFFLDERQRLVTVRKDALVADRGEVTRVSMPMTDKPSGDRGDSRRR